jgi:restriction system protein
MLPLLKYVSYDVAHTNRDVVDALASSFALTEEEKHEMQPSGAQPVFYNRVMWARFYLVKAGLLTSPKRGMMQITPRGQEVLKSKVEKLNVSYLKRFPDFIENQSPKRELSAATEPTIMESSQTPEEMLGGAYQLMRSALALELLTKVRTMDRKDFEDLVVKLLVQMGYGGSSDDVRHAFGSRTSDEGIDGTIKEDKLGLDVIHVQAKRWKEGNIVGRPELQKFVGALAGQGAKKGVFITASTFSKDARDYAPKNDTKIVLVDGEQLVEMMIDYNLGVTPRETYVVKRIDSDFFGEE